jgi:hypothetical protein
VEEETDGGEDADRWGPHVSEGKGKIKVPVRVVFLGRGLVPLLGQKGSLRPSFIFYFLFFFSFSDFLFLS